MWRTVPSSGKPAKTPRVSASWSPPILTASALELFISFCLLSLLMPHYGCSSQTCRAQKKKKQQQQRTDLDVIPGLTSLVWSIWESVFCLLRSLFIVQVIWRALWEQSNKPGVTGV